MSKKKNNSKQKSFGLAARILSSLKDGAVDIIQSYTNPAYNPYYDFWNLRYRGFRYKYFLEVFRLLEKRQWIEKVKKGPSVQIRITPKGWRYLRKKEFHSLRLNKPLIWDGLWRVVSFDIPEDDKKARNSFRRKLKNLGFVQVQKSLWVCPYECRQEIQVVTKYYDVQDYVALFEGKYLGDDRELRKRFNIK